MNLQQKGGSKSDSNFPLFASFYHNSNVHVMYIVDIHEGTFISHHAYFKPDILLQFLFQMCFACTYAYRQE